jgi:hypothetical protein
LFLFYFPLFWRATTLNKTITFEFGLINNLQAKGKNLKAGQVVSQDQSWPPMNVPLKVLVVLYAIIRNGIMRSLPYTW